ncbi:MAG: serine/threonine phosphatase PrpC [Labilithrix sp.]|nr:serine/threonine phosphatase PrpC [Labilithrix sp.]
MADPSSIPPVPPVEIAFRTDPGRDPEKQVNEDAAFHVETKHGLLAVVCDGMGGHAGGREASELATRTIQEIVSAAPDATAPRDALRVAIEEANRRVWGMPTDEGGYRPGSTVVAVLAHPGGAEVAHVGDSRVYLLHSGAIAQITKDHSMVQEMVDRNIIKAEDAAKHPDANKIMRALGIAKDVEVDLRPEPVAYSAGDVFVLCSDGLSDLVGPAEILDVAGSRPAAQAAGQLVDLANARGGHDNITAMVVRMKGSALATDQATIVKTVALTAVDRPAEALRGTGTVISAPASPSQVPSASSGSGGSGGPGGTALVAPMAPRSDHSVQAAAGNTEPPQSNAGGSAGRAAVAFGIVLAVIALGVAGWFLYNEVRPRHHSATPLVLPEAGTVTTSTEEEAGTPAAEVTLAPVLPPPSGVKVPWWKDPDAAAPTGEPRECAMARWQKEHGRPASSYEPLEAKCRAAGGKP